MKRMSMMAAILAASLSLSVSPVTALATENSFPGTSGIRNQAEENGVSVESSMEGEHSGGTGSVETRAETADTAGFEAETDSQEADAAGLEKASADPETVGDAEEADEGQAVKAQDMYRMYNPNSSEHFYTASAGERNSLIAAGWNYEGIGWVAPSTSDEPIYRLYNPNAGDHHYTASAGERNHLVAVGWRDEGVGWYSDTKKTVPVYREYNPNARTGAHNFTTSKSENDFLARNGWRAEGIAWYASAEGQPAVGHVVSYTNKTPLYQTGSYQRITSSGGTLHVAGDSLQSGQSIVTGSAASDSSDKWVVIINSDMTYSILGVRSGKYMGVSGNRIVSSDSAYHWTISPQSDGSFSISDGEKFVKLSSQGSLTLASEDHSSSEKFTFRQQAITQAGYQTIGGQRKYVDSTGVRDYLYPQAAAVLNKVGWNFRAAYNWSKGMPYFGHNSVMPSEPSNGYQWFANYGFTNYKGNCFVMAGTFYEMATEINLAQNQGYTIRQVYGCVNNHNGTKAPHSWVEMIKGGTTYICDPNFENEYPSYNGYFRTYGASGYWSVTKWSYMN